MAAAAAEQSRPALWSSGAWNAFFGFGTNVHQYAGADGSASLRSQDARCIGVRAYPSSARPDDVPLHLLLRFFGLSVGEANRALGWVRSALGRQCPPHVRRDLRHHVAHHFENRDPIKGWQAGLVWVFFQSFILMLGGVIAPYIRRITPAPPSWARSRASRSLSFRCGRPWKCS